MERAAIRLCERARADLKVGAWNYQWLVSRCFTDDGVLHLFVPHRWQQVLHLTIRESDLATLPTAAQLRALSAGQNFNPLAPPLGLKTYRDLGLMVDETILARACRDAGGEQGRVQKTLVDGRWVFPLFDKGNQIKLTLSDPRMLWSSFPRTMANRGASPRFVAALVGDAAIKNIEFRKAAGKTLHLTLEDMAGRKCDVHFREDDLCRLATGEDLRRAPPSRFVLTSVSPEQSQPRPAR